MTQSTTQPGFPKTVAGRYVVLGMFTLGIMASLGIWGYWKLYLAPFMPLQQALVAEFPRSSPRVRGGRHKQEPPLLRIVLSVPYPPVEEDPRVAATIERTITLAREHLDFREYEELEIYLVHYAPEKAPQQYEYKRPMIDVLEAHP